MFGVLISSYGHAQVTSPDTLQFQPINSQPQLAQGFNQNQNQQPQSQQGNQNVPTQVQADPLYPAHFPGSSPVNQVASLDGHRYQEIVRGSERFALDLFSVRISSDSASALDNS